MAHVRHHRPGAHPSAGVARPRSGDHVRPRDRAKPDRPVADAASRADGRPQVPESRQRRRTPLGPARHRVRRDVLHVLRRGRERRGDQPRDLAGPVDLDQGAHWAVVPRPRGPRSAGDTRRQRLGDVLLRVRRHHPPAHRRLPDQLRPAELEQRTRRLRRPLDNRELGFEHRIAIRDTAQRVVVSAHRATRRLRGHRCVPHAATH